MNFKEWFYTEMPLPVLDNRELVIGALGAMKQIVPRLQDMFAGPQKAGKTISHNNLVIQPMLDDNPYLLVVYDPKTKRFARGTNNCNVCQKYDVKAGTCTPFDKSKPVTQQSMQQYDMGGCVALNFLPYFGAGSESSKKYDGIVAAIAKGTIFHYKNGKLSIIYKPGDLQPVDPEEEEYKQLTPWQQKEKEEGY